MDLDKLRDTIFSENIPQWYQDRIKEYLKRWADFPTLQMHYINYLQIRFKERGFTLSKKNSDPKAETIASSNEINARREFLIEYDNYVQFMKDYRRVIL